MITDPRYTNATLNTAILAGCVVAFLGFGFSASFGVFLRPMSADLGWGREVFSLSVAVQALFWGIAQPVAGMVADRYGTARVLAFGAIFAALGFYLRGSVVNPDVFVLSGVIVGIGTGACSFPIVIVALGKVVSAKRRSFVMGLGTAAASLGMFAAAPISLAMIARFGWQQSIVLISLSFLAILPFLVFVARISAPTAAAKSVSDFGAAIKNAFQDRSYLCLFFGFFRLRISRVLHPDPPAGLRDRSGTCGARRRLVDCTDWTVQYSRVLSVWLVGAGLLQKESSQRHIFHPRHRNYRLYPCTNFAR